MAKQVLFIQGAGDDEAYDADAKLAESLQHHLGTAYEVLYPPMPNQTEPDYATWKSVILEQARGMGEGAILAGHSIGASVLIKLMTDSEPKPPIAGVFLAAAPFWHEDKVWHWDEVALPPNAADFYPREIPLFFYHSEGDEIVPVAHLDRFAKAFPFATVRRLRDGDHQLNNDLSEMARDIRG